VVSALLVALLGATAGLGVVLVLAAARGTSVLPPRPTAASPGSAGRGLAALAVGAVVQIVTGWPVAALAAAVAVVALPHVLGGAARHRSEVARVEAVAAWTEQLRDTIAAANGLEHAIAASAEVAPAPIAAEVGRLVARLDYERLPDALRSFADEVDHPAADFVVAGLIVASERQARDLASMLGQLAGCARDEAQMRSRVWAGRARTRTSVRVITGAVLLFAIGLVLFDRAYLAPYGSFGGQAMLGLVVVIFAAAFVAMDRMGRIEPPERFVGRSRT
jgi:Flp pilus assembly protein TadB